MDIATIIGILTASALVLWAIMSKVSLGTFVDPGSIAIVIGGSIGASLTCFPLSHVMGIAKVIKNAFFAKAQDPQRLIKDMVTYAEKARRDGILSLEDTARELDDRFIVSGIQMVVDGNDPELIEQILESDLDAMAERHATGKALFDGLGKYAPAFGMIGTLIGLVIMLQNMEDPAMIGPGMAVALLTTLYGSMVANMIALPIADKLAIRSSEELVIKNIIVRGIMSIQAGDNPRVVEQKLQSFLPPSMREGEDQAQAA